MGKKSVLSPECQKFVQKLFAFFSKEKARKKSIVSFDRVFQKTSKALGVSCTSVKRFDLSQIITPIIDNRHLIIQNSSIITYFFNKYIQDQ
jgi:predicted nucleic-acid-binding protein